MGAECGMSPCLPCSNQPRAGAVGQQVAHEETPCFHSCAQLWHLSQNKINWHHILWDSPLSPAIPPGEIPGVTVLCWLVLPDSQTLRWEENRELGEVIKAAVSVGTWG